MRKLTPILILICLLLVTFSSQAQDNIWVTTQDNLALRLGPGLHWERVTILPPATTLQAVGRTVRTDWIQVAYEDPLASGVSDEATIDGITYGWVSSDYLIWSGNVLLLPVDGIETTATSRRTGPLLLIDSETLFFEILGDFANPIQYDTDEPISVEVTGRIGSRANGYFWLQFILNGNYYWTPTWETGVPTGANGVLDASYLFPFGRVYTAIASDASTARSTLNNIRGRWRDLDTGFAATCNNIPEQLILDEILTETNDVAQASIMEAPLTVLQSALDNINIAIANFESVCNQPLEGRTASAQIIADSLSLLAQASEELSFLGVLLNPIADRNPVVG